MRGLEAFSDVLDLVRNADKYEAQVKELKQLLASIQEASGGANRLAKAAEFEAAAEKVLAKAREEAEVIKGAAEAHAAARRKEMQDADAQLQKRKSEVNDLAFQSQTAKATCEAKTKELEKELAKAAEKTKALEAAEARMAAKEAELADRLDKLRSVMQ